MCTCVFVYISEKGSSFDNAGSGQKAKVVHKYAPRQKDELALEVGMVIEILPSVRPSKLDDELQHFQSQERCSKSIEGRDDT